MVQKVNLEDTIIASLVSKEDYCRKVLPFLKDEYFSTEEYKHVFKLINEFVTKYNKSPTKQVLSIELGNKPLSEKIFNRCMEIVDLVEEQTIETDWIIDETEKFCKDRALYNALLRSVQIVEGNDRDTPTDAIPSILQDALATCFDSSIGHDYFEDMGERFEFYTNEEERIPFLLKVFNKITKGGLFRKTLTCFSSRTGGGKSMMGTHLASDYLKQGYNVLYITMEMAEKQIAQRVDANLLNTKSDELPNLTKEKFTNRLSAIQEKTSGKLIIKEYPTGGAHAGHFDSLLQELKLKKKFVPDVVIVDYIGICSSQRVKNSSANSNTIIKSITEELRSLAIKHNVVMISFMQLNRGGVGNTDVDETDTADSFGSVFTFDLMIALIRTEELDDMGQIMCKILKTRYNDPNFFKRFIIGVDMSKMKFYDPDDTATEDLVYTKMQNEQRIEKSKAKGKVAMDEVEEKFDFSKKQSNEFSHIKVTPKAGFDAFTFD